MKLEMQAMVREIDSPDPDYRRFEIEDVGKEMTIMVSIHVKDQDKIRLLGGLAENGETGILSFEW